MPTGFPTINSINSKLSLAQKCAKEAENRNLLFNPVTSSTTITSPTSAPSTSGFSNLLPAATGYAASVTGNTTSGSAVITGVSATTALKIGQPIMEAMSGYLYPTNIPLGATIVSVDSASQITISKAATGTATGITLKTFPQEIQIYGGVLGGYNGNMKVIQHHVSSATPSTGSQAYALEFLTDAANVTTAATAIILAFYQNGVTPNSYKVAIDDVYQTAIPQTFGSTGSTWLTIQFSTPGVHKIRIEVPGGYLMQQLWLINGAKLWKPETAINISAVFFGDSFSQGGEMTNNWAHANIAWRTAIMLGWNFHNSGQGGTGYIANGTINYAWTDPLRYGDVGILPYDFIVIFGTVNDGAQSSANEAAAALTTWRGIRSVNPKATIFIFGVPTTTQTNAATAATLESGLSTAFASWGDSNAYYFPITSDPNGAWLDANNNSLYIYSGDGTHLTDKGCQFVASKMVQKIRSILNLSTL